jgi:hypothetical protein
MGHDLLMILGNLLLLSLYVVIPVVLLITIVGTLVRLSGRGQRRVEAARLEEEDDRRDDARRVKACGEVVLAYANNLGYAAREVISRQELSDLIDTGITADHLNETINERIAALDGVLLGLQRIGAEDVPAKLPISHRTRHVYCVGKSGSGKTTLLRNLILQDLECGNGIGVIAPEHEMLFEEILPYIPAHRVDDIVYVNPADTECPIPLNPLELEEGENLDLKADETMTIFKRMFDEEGGGSAPRMDTILRQALYALMQVPGTTLLDMEKLLDRSDASFRERVVKQIDDPEAEYFWTHTYPMYPRDAHLPIVNRLGRFLRPKVVRNILCSPGKSLNIRQAMDEGRVLLFNLSDGILGEANAQLLGQLVVAKIQMAAMSRANVAKSERRPFYLYIDEFQSFCGVAATSYEKILSRARKYGLGLILAHQQTGQVPEHLMREILGNVSTVVSFLVSASDAKRLSREMVGEAMGEPVGLEPHALLSLQIGEAYCRVNRNVFSIKTFPPPAGPSERMRDTVIERSRENYGRRSGERSAGVTRQQMVTPHSIEQIDPAAVF